MAVPSSPNAISMRGIRREIATNNYSSTNTYSNISLEDMSEGVNGTINANSTLRPDGVNPHKMSEFHGYDHDAAGLNLVVTRSGAYNCTSWENIGFSASSYKGEVVRLVFHYVSGNSYTGDLQIDAVRYPVFQQGSWTQLTHNFGTSSFTKHSFTTTTSNTSSYSNASFSSINTTITNGVWNGKSGGTGSGDTGLSSGYGGSGFYVYAETSSFGGTSGNPNVNFWMRSASYIVPDLVGTPYFGFQLGRCGAAIGTLKVYVEVL